MGIFSRLFGKKSQEWFEGALKELLRERLLAESRISTAQSFLVARQRETETSSYLPIRPQDIADYGIKQNEKKLSELAEKYKDNLDARGIINQGFNIINDTKKLKEIETEISTTVQKMTSYGYKISRETITNVRTHHQNCYY
jgi:hypothetical protein